MMERAIALLVEKLERQNGILELIEQHLRPPEKVTRPKPAPKADSLTMEDLTRQEQDVAKALMSDPIFSKTVVRPMRLARDLVAASLPGVNVVAEVVEARMWLQKNNTTRPDGNRYLINWWKNVKPRTTVRPPSQQPGQSSYPARQILNQRVAAAEAGVSAVMGMFED